MPGRGAGGGAYNKRRGGVGYLAREAWRAAAGPNPARSTPPATRFLLALLVVRAGGAGRRRRAPTSDDVEADEDRNELNDYEEGSEEWRADYARQQALVYDPPPLGEQDGASRPRRRAVAAAAAAAAALLLAELTVGGLLRGWVAAVTVRPALLHCSLCAGIGGRWADVLAPYRSLGPGPGGGPRREDLQGLRRTLRAS